MEWQAEVRNLYTQCVLRYIHAPGRKYQTNTDKLVKHPYTLLYNQIFKSCRKENLAYLEIGVDRGAHLRAMVDYFENSQITGIDILDQRPEYLLTPHPRLSFYIADSSDLKTANDLFKDETFDIIVEDGNHHPDSQINTAKVYGQKLKKDGIYIVEDVNPAYTDQLAIALESFFFTSVRVFDFNDPSISAAYDRTMRHHLSINTYSRYAKDSVVIVATSDPQKWKVPDSLPSFPKIKLFL